MKDNLKYVGDPKAQPVDGLDKVLGRAKYVGDMSLAGMLHAKILASPVPHAKILKLDTSPALDVPGVLAVITSDDFVENGPLGFPIKDAFVLAHKKVRYAGDPIATVAAETLEAAEAGIKAIILELEELPTITTPEDALKEDAPLIPLEAPQKKGNLCDFLIVRNGNPDPVLDVSEHKFNQSYYFQHQEHAYLETEGALAIPEPGGGVTVFANDQSPHINRFNTASVLGLPPEQVRIIQPPVGGSFGGKDDIGYQLTAQVARLALNTNCPVRLILSREESILISYKRAAMSVQLNIGMDAAGNIRAGKAKMVMDSGAYASMSPLAAWRTTMHALGVYKYEAGHVDTQVVYTNNGYSGAFRGFGSPQAAAASEIAIDELAHLAKTDPIEFRLKNIIRKGDVAFTGNKITYESGLEKCLEWVRDASDWNQKKDAYPQADAETLRGVGVACYFHGSGLGGEGLDYARTTIKIEKDHSITLQSGMTDYGQGSRTVFTLIAAETLGVQPARVHMLRPDTQTAEETGPTVASRTTMVGGNATKVASQKITQLLNLAASDLLDCNPNQLLRDGEDFIGPDETPIKFDEIVDHAFEMGLQLSALGYWQLPEIHWDFKTGTGTPYTTYAYGAQVADVSVSRETGAVVVNKVWAAHDASKIIYPNGAKGQLIGGIAQGLGYALMEGFTFKDGYPEKKNLFQYKIPTALDMPEVEVNLIETNFPDGPFGAKNIAEPALIATLPAIANAIFHATGLRCREFPISAKWLKEKI